MAALAAVGGGSVGGGIVGVAISVGDGSVGGGIVGVAISVGGGPVGTGTVDVAASSPTRVGVSGGSSVPAGAAPGWQATSSRPATASNNRYQERFLQFILLSSATSYQTLCLGGHFFWSGVQQSTGHSQQIHVEPVSCLVSVKYVPTPEPL